MQKNNIRVAQEFSGSKDNDQHAGKDECLLVILIPHLIILFLALLHSQHLQFHAMGIVPWKKIVDREDWDGTLKEEMGRSKGPRELKMEQPSGSPFGKFSASSLGGV